MSIHIGKHEFKRRKLIAVIAVVLFAVLALGGTVYAVTTDLGGLGALFNGSAVGADVPAEAEEAGYTRGLRINAFTVNGLNGSNAFCLKDGERNSISFYKNPEAGSGSTVSSSNTFDITSGNSFLIDPTMDSISIVAPRQTNSSCKYLDVRVKVGGYNVTENPDISVVYHSNLQDHAISTDTFVTISGLSQFEGDIEIDGTFLHLHNQTYIRTYGRTFNTDDLQITVTGKNDYSLLNEQHSYPWKSYTERWLDFGGTYIVTVNEGNPLEKMVLRYTDLDNNPQEIVYYANSDGTLEFTLPENPMMKSGPTMYYYFEREGYRRINFNGFKTNAFAGNNSFYLTEGGGGSTSFFNDAGNSREAVDSSKKDFSITSNYLFYIDSTLDSIRVAAPHQTNCSCKYRDVRIKADGVDITEDPNYNINIEYVGNLEDHARTKDAYFEISGLSGVRGDLEIDGYFVHLHGETFITANGATLGPDSVSITVMGLNDYSMLSERTSFTWTNTSTSIWLDYEGSYIASVNSSNGYKLNGVTLTYTDIDNEEHEEFFEPNHNGKVVIDLPEVMAKSGNRVYLNFDINNTPTDFTRSLKINPFVGNGLMGSNTYYLTDGDKCNIPFLYDPGNYSGVGAANSSTGFSIAAENNFYIDPALDSLIIRMYRNGGQSSVFRNIKVYAGGMEVTDRLTIEYFDNFLDNARSTDTYVRITGLDLVNGPLEIDGEHFFNHGRTSVKTYGRTFSSDNLNITVTGKNSYSRQHGVDSPFTFSASTDKYRDFDYPGNYYATANEGYKIEKMILTYTDTDGNAQQILYPADEDGVVDIDLPDPQHIKSDLCMHYYFDREGSRRVRFNRFTVNGMGGDNKFYLTDGDGNNISFYQEEGNSRTLYDSSKKDFYITSSYLFSMDSNLDTLKINYPIYYSWSSKYQNVVVKENGVNANDKLEFDYHSNFEDHGRTTESFVIIRGLKKLDGELEIDGEFLHLHGSTFITMNGAALGSGVSLTITGLDDNSKLNVTNNSYTWTNVTDGRDLDYDNGHYFADINSVNGYRITEMILTYTDIHNMDWQVVYPANENGNVFFTLSPLFVKNNRVTLNFYVDTTPREYTRSLKINGFTVSGTSGTNTYYLRDGDRGSISFYNESGAYTGTGVVTSSDGFNIASDNSFLIQDNLDSIRIISPRDTNNSCRYRNITVKANNIDVTEKLDIDYYENFADHARKNETYVKISGLSRVNGPIEIDGEFIHLHHRVWFRSYGKYINTDGIRVALEGLDEYSQLTEESSYTWASTAQPYNYRYMDSGGRYKATANDGYAMYKAVMTYTGASGNTEEIVFPASSDGTVTFTMPTDPTVKSEMTLSFYFEWENLRRVKFDGFTVNGLGGNNYFYLTDKNDGNIEFYHENNSARTKYDSTKKDFNISSKYTFYMEPGLDSIRIHAPQQRYWACKYDQIKVKANGADITSQLNISYYNNLTDHGYNTETYATIDGLARYNNSELEITGEYIHARGTTYITVDGAPLGTGGVKITVAGQNGYSLINNTTSSYTWTEYTTGRDLDYGGSYTASVNTADGYAFIKMELSYIDLNGDTQTVEYTPDSSGKIPFDLPLIMNKPGKSPYLNFYVDASSAAQVTSTRLLRFNAFTVGGYRSTTNFYVSNGDGSNIPLIYGKGSSGYGAADSSTAFDIGVNNDIYIDPSLDSIRITAGMAKNWPNRYRNITVKAGGVNVNSKLDFNYVDNFEDHAQRVSSYVIISGLNLVDGDLEIDGEFLRLQHRTNIRTCGRYFGTDNGLNVTLTGLTTSSMIDDQQALRIESLNPSYRNLVSGGSYMATSDGGFTLEKAVLTYTDVDGRGNSTTFNAAADGSITFNMPVDPLMKYDPTLTFYYAEENYRRVELNGFTLYGGNSGDNRYYLTDGEGQNINFSYQNGDNRTATDSSKYNFQINNSYTYYFDADLDSIKINNIRNYDGSCRFQNVRVMSNGEDVTDQLDLTYYSNFGDHARQTETFLTIGDLHKVQGSLEITGEFVHIYCGAYITFNGAAIGENGITLTVASQTPDCYMNGMNKSYTWRSVNTGIGMDYAGTYLAYINGANGYKISKMVLTYTDPSGKPQEIEFDGNSNGNVLFDLSPLEVKSDSRFTMNYYVDTTPREYTRSLRINPFTVNYTGTGTSSFNLLDGDRGNISFLNDSGAGSGEGIVTSETGFDIAAGNSFKIDPSLDAIRIRIPRQENASCRFRNVTVKVDGEEITDIPDIHLEYFENFEDHARENETYLLISGLKNKSGDIEIDGEFLRLHNRMYLRTVGKTFGTDNVSITVNGENDQSLINNVSTLTWNDYSERWIDLGGEYTASATGGVIDQLVVEYTDIYGKKQMKSFLADENGVVSFTMPVDPLINGSTLLNFFFVNDSQRRINFKPFTTNGLHGNNQFYLTQGEGESLSFQYYSDNKLYNADSTKKNFYITNEYNMFFDADLDTLRINNPCSTSNPCRFEEVRVKAGGYDVTGQLDIDYFSNSVNHAQASETFVKIKGLKDIPGELEITGKFTHLYGTTSMTVTGAALGANNMSITIQSLDYDHYRVDDRASYTWTGYKDVSLDYEGSYMANVNSVHGYTLKRVTLTYTDSADQPRTKEYLANENGNVIIDLPTPDIKSGTKPNLKFDVNTSLVDYDRSLKINPFTTNGMDGNNLFYLSDNDGGHISFIYDTGTASGSGTATTANTFDILAGNQFYIESDRNSIRINHSREGWCPTDYCDVKVKINGDDVTEHLTIIPHDDPPFLEDTSSTAYIEISGLAEYQGPIEVSGSIIHLRGYTYLTTVGEHSADITITGDTPRSVEEGKTSWTWTSSDIYSNWQAAPRMVYGESYTVTSSGDDQHKISEIKLSYVDFSGVTQEKTYPADENGEVYFTLPHGIKKNVNSRAYLTVYFVDAEGCSFNEAQVFIGADDTSVVNRGHVKVTASDSKIYDMRNGSYSASGYTYNYGGSRGLDEAFLDRTTSSSYDSVRKLFINAGARVTVEDAIDTTLPADQQQFKDDRFELVDVKVYKVESFAYDSNGSATFVLNDNGNRSEVPVVNNGSESFYFEMPDCPVRIQPIYKDHVRSINMMANDNKRLYGDESDMGTVRLTPTDDCTIFINGHSTQSKPYVSNSLWGFAADGSLDPRMAVTVDGKTFTLTATPYDAEGYRPARIEFYQLTPYSVTSTETRPENGIDWNETYPILDSSGNPRTDVYPDVTDRFTVTPFGEADENGTRSCTFTLPDDLDFGNIGVLVYFEPIVTDYAHFKYIKQDGISNDYVCLSGAIKNNLGGRVLTNIASETDVEAAVYDEDNPAYLKMQLGGTARQEAAMYNRNKVYTLTDYTTDIELLKFRIHNNTLTPVAPYTQEDLDRYIVVDEISPIGDTASPYHKISLNIKLPANGIVMSYVQDELYIPVTVKQFIKNGESTIPAGEDFSVDVEARFFDGGYNDNADYRQRHFASEDPYASDKEYDPDHPAGDTEFTSNSVTVSGDQMTLYTKFADSSLSHGYVVTPGSMAESFVLSPDNPFEAYAVNSNGEICSLNNNLNCTDIGDGSCRVSYYNSGQGHLLGESIVIEIYYETNDSTYFSYMIDDTISTYRPKATINNSPATSGKRILTQIYDEEAEEKNYTTLVLGGDTEGSAFYEENLVYSLRYYMSPDNLAQFRIYRGQLIPVGDTTAADLNEYIHSFTYEDVDNTDELCGKATLKFKVPSNGLSLLCRPDRTYLPVTVNQYVVDAYGSPNPAGSGFTATLSKSDLVNTRLFLAKDNTIDDSYGLSTADIDSFAESLDAVGESDTHYMLYSTDKGKGGLYVMPNAPEGYSVALVQAKAYNRSDTEINETRRQNLTEIPTEYDGEKGYLISYDECESSMYLQSASMTINVYYNPKIALTVKQTLDGNMNGTLAEVKLDNVNEDAPASPFTSFIDDEGKFVSSVTLTDTAQNMIETDPNNPGAHIRTSYIQSNIGTKPQITIKPHGSRSVLFTSLTKKSGDEYYSLTEGMDYTVSGSGSVNGTLVYTFLNPLEAGDDISLDIVYSYEKTLTVEAVYLDSDNVEHVVDTDALFEATGATINVTGTNYDQSGLDIPGSMPFVYKSLGTEEKYNNFIVTNAPKTYTVKTNTRLSIQTNIDPESEYVISGVRSLNDNGDYLNLVVAGTNDYNGQSVYTYDRVTLPTLTSSDNVTVKVVLAKKTSLKVKVVTIMDDGVSTRDGVPGPSAYVNITGINYTQQNALITKEDEGNYYTDSIEITYDPAERDVYVTQGTQIEIFAQLPRATTGEQYVIRKIDSNVQGFSDINVDSIEYVADNLRESLNTGDERISADKRYEIVIYIEKAKSIFTRVTNETGGLHTASPGGQVTVTGNIPETGAVPFAKIAPVADVATHPQTDLMEYDAKTVLFSADYTTEAACIRGTSLGFKVKPEEHYSIGSITVKRGDDKDSATDVTFNKVYTDDNGTITYKISGTMPYNDNLYIDVVFTATDTSKVTIDAQYTDDFMTYKNMFDTDDGLGSMSLKGVLPDVPGKKIYDPQRNESYDEISGVTYKSDTYQVNVIAGTNLSVQSTIFKDGKWYVCLSSESYVFDNNTNKIRVITEKNKSVEAYLNDSNYTYAFAKTNVGLGDDLTIHLRYVPASRIGSFCVNNNRYDDEPDNVRKQISYFVNVHTRYQNGYSITPDYTTRTYDNERAWKDSTGKWTNNGFFGINGDIVAGTVIERISVNYKNYISPGVIKNVYIYEYDKEGGLDIGISSLHSNPAAAEPTRTIALTKSGDSNETNYVYEPETPITVDRDKAYMVYVEYDLIEVSVNKSGVGSDKMNAYIYFGAESPDEIKINSQTADHYVEAKPTVRFDQSVKNNESAYLVLVSDCSLTDLDIVNAIFVDYDDYYHSVDILETLKESASVRYHSGGITKYYYFYRINPDDVSPIDNSMKLDIVVRLRSNPSVTSDDCSITVEQLNRTTYDGSYVVAMNQSVALSVKENEVLKTGDPPEDANPAVFNEELGYAYSKKGNTVTVKPDPDEDYYVEKVTAEENGIVHNLNGNIETGYSYKLTSDSAVFRVYYSKPLIRISSTNEGNQGKANVDLYNSTTGELKSILTTTTYTNGDFVDKNDDLRVIIRPVTYEQDGERHYYSVASIRVGNAFNNTLPVYTAERGDIEGDDYSITMKNDGSEYVLSIDNVVADKYIFVQLLGEEQKYNSNLMVNQMIQYPGNDDYVDCEEGSYGTINLIGSMNFDGVDYNTYSFNDKASVEGTVQSHTGIKLSVVPPDEYIVKSVEAVMNGEPVSCTLENGVYTLSDLAPDSGTTSITVKYAPAISSYNLYYVYQGRKGGNEGSYAGDGGETDEKVYSVYVSLYPAQMTDDGKPTAKILTQYAPAVEDLYKDCVWKIDDVHVTYGDDYVTVRAEQPAKKYTVEFYVGDNADEPLVIEQVPLNSLVKPDGNFVTAPEKYGEDTFSCWEVTSMETGTVIARSLNTAFNLRVTGNIIVTAKYNAEVNLISISDPEFSREQTSDGKDTLYADFILAYMTDNDLLLSEKASTEYQTGLIIEQNRKIRLNKEDVEGAVVSTEERAQAIAQYNVSDAPILTAEGVKDMLKGDVPTSSGDTRYLIYSVNNESYNNRNRVDKALSVANSAVYRQLVMRAYYYVYNIQTDTVELSEPVYFYFYDIGNSVKDTTVASTGAGSATPDEVALKED